MTTPTARASPSCLELGSEWLTDDTDLGGWARIDLIHRRERRGRGEGRESIGNRESMEVCEVREPAGDKSLPILPYPRTSHTSPKHFFKLGVLAVQSIPIRAHPAKSV